MSKGGGTPATQSQSVDIPPEFKSFIFGPGMYGRTAGGVKGPSRLQGTLGGAATGAQLGSFAGPMGAAIGAGIGGLTGLFGSKRRGGGGTPAQHYDPGFAGILPSAVGLMNSGDLAPSVRMSEGTQMGQDSLLKLVESLNNNFLPQTQDLFNRVGNRDLVNSDEVRNVIDASTRPIQEQLNRYQIPGTQDAALAAGQLGSSRQGIAEGLARSDANNQMGDIASRIAFGALQEQLQGERQALNFSPQMMAMMGMPTGMLQDLGRQQEYYDLEERSSSSNNLRALASLLQGFIPGANATQTQTGATTGMEGFGSTAATLQQLLSAFGGTGGGAPTGGGNKTGSGTIMNFGPK